MTQRYSPPVDGARGTGEVKWKKDTCEECGIEGWFPSPRKDPQVCRDCIVEGWKT